MTIKVENGTAKTITVSPVDDKKADDTETTVRRASVQSVDVAILLDTSSSMNGLIGQAQGQLWNIIQEFSKAEKAGQDSAASSRRFRIRKFRPAR